MFMFASILVVLAVVTMAVGMTVACLVSRPHAVAGFLPYLAMAVLLAGGLAGATYGPTDNPEALEAKAHALQVSGMYHQAERSAIGAPGADPFRKGAIAEDLACLRAEEWYGAAMDIDLR